MFKQCGFCFLRNFIHFCFRSCTYFSVGFFFFFFFFLVLVLVSVVFFFGFFFGLFWFVLGCFLNLLFCFVSIFVLLHFSLVFFFAFFLVFFWGGVFFWCAFLTVCVCSCVKRLYSSISTKNLPSRAILPHVGSKIVPPTFLQCSKNSQLRNGSQVQHKPPLRSLKFWPTIKKSTFSRLCCNTIAFSAIPFCPNFRSPFAPAKPLWKP